MELEQMSWSFSYVCFYFSGQSSRWVTLNIAKPSYSPFPCQSSTYLKSKQILQLILGGLYMNTFQEQPFIVHVSFYYGTQRWMCTRSCLGRRHGLKHAGSISGGQQNLCKLSLMALEHAQRPGLATLEAVQTKSYVGHNKGNFYSDEHL